MIGKALKKVQDGAFKPQYVSGAITFNGKVYQYKKSPYSTNVINGFAIPSVKGDTVSVKRGSCLARLSRNVFGRFQ
jgi:hypothetical protein